MSAACVGACLLAKYRLQASFHSCKAGSLQVGECLASDVNIDYNFGHRPRLRKDVPLGACPDQQLCFPVRTRQLAMVTLPPVSAVMR